MDGEERGERDGDEAEVVQRIDHSVKKGQRNWNEGTQVSVPPKAGCEQSSACLSACLCVAGRASGALFPGKTTAGDLSHPQEGPRVLCCTQHTHDVDGKTEENWRRLSLYLSISV